MGAVEIADLLKDGGPWGFSALLLAIIGFLVRHILKLVDERDSRQSEYNQKMLELLEKKIETDIKHEQAFRELTKVVEKLTDRM